MANKNSVNIQLNINTAFTNIDQAVKDFKSKISNLNISEGLELDLTKNFQKQAKEIQSTLKQVGTFDFTTGSSKEYLALVTKLKNEYSSLSAMIKQYRDTFVTTADSVIQNQNQIINSITKDIDAKKAQLDVLKQGEAAYNKQVSGVGQLSEEEKKLAQIYSNNIPQIKQLNSEITTLTKSRAGHKGVVTKLTKESTNYQQILGQEEQTLKVTKSSIDSVTSANAKNLEQLKQLEQLKKSETKAAEEAAKAAEKEAKAKQELQKVSQTFVKDITKEDVETDKLTNAISQQIIQWTSFSAIVHAAQRAIKDIIQTYQELDDNLSAISAVSGISTQELWGDMPSMIDNANKLALSINDLTDGMLTLYQQGLNTAEVETRLDAAGKLAAISQQDLGTAVDQLTAIMNTFNLSTEDSARVVDILANESANSAISVAELGTALQPVASLAASAGMSLETTTAFITTMESTTRQSASVIGNALKTIIARFQQLKTSSDELEDGTSANDVEKALASAGVALRDATGNFRDFDEVIMELSSKWDTLDSNTQRYIATVGAGTRQQSQFIALVSNYAKNVENISTATNSAGAAEKQFQAVSNNLSSALTRLDNSFASLKTSWTGSINIITLLVDALSALVNVIAKVPLGLQLATAAFGVLIVKQTAAELASQKLVIQMAKETAARKMLSSIEDSSLDSDKKLVVLKELLSAKSKGLSASELYLSGVLKDLTKAERVEIISAYKSITANETLKISFDLIRTSALKAAAAIKAFILENPEIVAIAAVVGIAVTAFTALQNQSKKTQEQIDNLTNSIRELNSSAQETQGIADSLDGYIDALKQAHGAGEDLTSIRKEIEKSGYLEKTGVDVLTASYEDLLEILQQVSDEKGKQASIERGKALNKQAELNKINTEDAYKNTSDDVHTAYYKNNGEDVSNLFIESHRYSSDPEIQEDIIEQGLKVKYYAIIDGQKKYFDTYKAAKEAIYDARDKQETPSQNYSNQNAQDLINTVESVEQDFFTSLNLSAEQSISLIKIWGSKIGNAIIDEKTNTITPAFRDFMEDVGPALTENANQLNITTEDIFNYLNGNFTNLNYETISAIQEALNSTIASIEDNQKDQLQIFTNDALENYDNTRKQLSNKLTSGDYQIIDKTTAERIGIQGLQILEDTLERQGAKSAEALGNIFSDLISQGISNTNLESAMSQLYDAFSNLDVSDIDSVTKVTEQLQSLANQGIITNDQVIVLLNTLGEYNKTIGLLTSSTNQANSQVEFFNQALDNGYNTFEEMEQAATTAGLSIEEVGAHIDSTTGKWIASKDAVHNYAVELGNATAAEANSILAKAALENQSLANAIAMDNEAIASNGLTTTEVGNTIMALQSKKEKAKADVDLAQSAVDSAKTQLDVAQGNAAAVEGSVNSQAENQKIAIRNTSKMGQAIKSIIEGIVNAWPALGKFFGGFSDAIGVAADETVESAKSSADAVADAQKNLDNANENLAAAQDHLNEIDQGISILESYKGAINGATNGLKNYGQAAKRAGSGGSSAANGTNEATDALEAQKDALQKVINQWEDYKSKLEDSKQALEDQKSALEELNDKLKDNLELYLDLIKTKLNDEIDRQTTAVEAYYDAIKNTIQSQIDAFEDQLDELKRKADELQDKADELQEEAEKQEDSLNKLYEAATSYYEAVQSGIDNEINLQDDAIEKNEYKISLLEQQKEAIQEQIDNLDKAADSESKLLNLEKARDALANARNQKTRMVLTNGGGWRLKTDAAAVQDAQSNLASAEKDYQKELLERQQEKLDDQISELEEQNDKIEDIKEDLEEQKDSIDNIIQDWDDAADNLGKTTSELEEQTRLLEMIAQASQAERDDMLNDFQSNVAQNNDQFQNASDATNEVNQASNEYDYQNNADNQDSISAAIEALKQQQNLTDEALKQYFENLLSNNAEEVAIQQQMQELVNQIIQNGNGSLEAFLEYQGQINEALQAANEFASNQAEYINKINETIGFYEEWSNRLDMTSSEINERQQIMNEINNSTLASLLEGGSTFNQLQGQYDEIVRNNDEAVRIQEQIDEIDAQIDQVQDQIDSLKAQQEEISKQEQQLSNANTNKTTSAAKSAGSGVSKSVSNASTEISGATDKVNKSVGTFQTDLSFRLGVVNGSLTGIKSVLDQINQKDFNITVNSPVSGYLGGVGGRSFGGPIGFSTGGVDDFTKTVAVHGTKNRPELVLNNSQSAALFKYIDSMTRIPTLSSAGSARNALQAFNNTTNNTTNEGTSFTGCEFNIESNASNLDSLVRELKQSSSIKRK